MTAALDLIGNHDVRGVHGAADTGCHTVAPDPWREEGPRAGGWATVTVLRPSLQSRSAAPVRLTRRGVVAVVAVLAALGVALVVLAARSAPVAAGAGAAPHAVTVHAGDTLWSIAARVAPARDTGSEVSLLQRANGLVGVDLVPGQVLRVP